MTQLRCTFSGKIRWIALFFLSVSIFAAHAQKRDTLMQKRSAATLAEEDPVSPMAGLFNDNLITPSPDGCALVRSVSTPVDKYSGVASIQIPLTEFKIDEASIPVALNYNAGGIRVNEVASTVGLGWKLSAGGRITRVVKGYPDDLEDFSNRRIMLDEAGWTRGVYDRRQEEQFDTQPDYFYFEYPGGGGMFVFDENGIPRTVPGQKIDIRCENGHFVVTDTDGTSYRYFTTETSSYTMEDVDPKPKDTYVSTWFLDQIEYINGSVVYFDYVQSSDYSYVNYNATARFTYSPQYGFTLRRTNAEDVTNTTIRPKLLTAIRYRGYKVEFSYTSRRTDIPGMSELSEIRSLYDGVEKKVYALGYGKFANGNLKLTQVLDYSNRRVPQQVCAFDYYENVNLPARSSYATDHWGYFNNASTGNKRHPQLQMRVGSTYGIDKTPNVTYAVANTLKKIRYATGGSKEFFYELHAGADPATGAQMRGGGLRTKEIHEKTDSLAKPAVTSYDYRGGMVYAPRPNYCSWADEDYTIDNVTRDTIYRSCTYDISARPLEPVTDLNGCSVVYSAVVERMPDKSFIEYEYVPYAEAPDEVPTHFEIEGFSGPLSSEMNARVPRTSLHWKRNLLKKKREYDADARMVRQTRYHYVFPVQNKYAIPGMKSYTSDYIWYAVRPTPRKVIRFSKYEIYSAPVYMVQEVVEEGPFNLASTTNYAYDYNRMLPTGVQRVDSDGNRTQTLMTYPSDYATGTGANEYLAGLAGLKARKAETMPVETIRMRNNILVDATLNLYKMVNDRPMLVEIKQFFPERPEGTIGFGRCRVENGGLVYDSRYERVMQNTDFSLENRVLSSLSQGDRRQSVVYGYDGTLPIATVPNVRHSIPERIASHSAEPLRDLGQTFTIYRRRDVGFELDFFNNSAPHKELCVEVRRQGVQSLVYSLHMVPARGYSRFFVDLEAGNYQLAVRWADAGNTSPLPSIAASVEEESVYSVAGQINEVFYTSFEPGSAHLPAAQYLKKVATAKSGEWVCTGNYTLSFSGFPAGTYELSYWTYNTAAANWSRTWKNVTVDDAHRSYTIPASASYYIDEVRFIPRNAQLTTFTYDPVYGKTSETDLNEATTYYTYDASGRLASILDSERSLRKRYTYQGMTKIIEETPNGSAELNRKITYLDGLGRPEQIVEFQASPTNKDIVHFIEYDDMGRDDAITYLPYTVTGGGVKRSNPYGEQVSFYFSMYGAATAIYPYHYRFYDRSPLGLLLKERRPKDHRNAEALYETQYEYRPNTAADSIRRYMMRGDSTVVWNGYYPSGALMVKRTSVPVTSLDDQSVVYEYTDAENRIVAKEVRVAAGDRRMTYTVYDGLGRQRYLIPPAGNDLFAASGAARNPHELHAYCYYYVYDKYGNATQTLIPGADWHYALYDKRGRLVLSQKGELRNETDPARNRWMFTRYDALDRPVATGIYRGGTFQTHRAALMQQTDFSSSYPTVGSDAEILSTTDYDNYVGGFCTYKYEKKVNRDGSVVAFQTTAEAAPARGRVTRRVNKVLNRGENRSLATTFHYDADGHTIQTVTELYPKGTELVLNHLDAAGNVVYVYNRQQYENYLCGYGKTLKYDKQNRLTDIFQTVFENHGEKIIGPDGLPNDDPRNGTVHVVSYKYDELGRVASKQIHGGVETTEYKYDIRDMVLSSVSPSFSYRLSYDNPTVPGVTARFNGTPGSQTWSRLDGMEQGYRYTYDRMGQLVESEMMEKAEGVWGAVPRCAERMTYDRSGNIATIQRTYTNGRRMAPMNLTYDGYRLTQVTTPADSLAFAYDRDGNLTDDGSRKVRMEYNILGLPQRVYDDSREAYYVYSADGTKLAMISKHAYPIYYRGMFTFQGGRSGAVDLISLQHPEGFVACNGYRQYTYKYFKSDHTRSNRTLLSVYQGTATVEQEMDYTPYGFSAVAPNLHLNRKLYAGKEMQDAFGSSRLAWYDFGARHYYPMFGRWFNVDPALQGFNPYMYCGNAPTAYIDQDGRFFWWIVGAAALLGGYMGGAAAEKDWNVLDWAWDGKTWGGILGGAIQGAIGGATMGYGVSALSGPFFSQKGFTLAGKIFRYSSLTFTAAKTFATGASMINNFSNAMDIIRGNYMYSGKTFAGQLWRGISRATWERPQQYIGYTYSQGRNGFHKGIEVEYFHGATVVNDPGSSKHRGITMGNMINGWQIHKDNDSMLYHEYGHTIQSSLWGVLYLPVVGVASAMAAGDDNGAWTEKAANRYSRNYFGQDEWDRTAGSVTEGKDPKYPLY